MSYTKREYRDRDNFRALCVREGLEGDHDRADLADLIVKDATSYNRIQELWCSVEMTDRQTRALEKKERQIEERITRRCSALGFRAEFGGDPRGYCVKVFLPSGKFNTWGGAENGFGVPCGCA